MTTPFYKLLDCSSFRKVFVVGDIHGEFRKLDAALIEVGFQPETDILISVGDIVDRGPYNEEFENYIDKSWFLRVLGDHELQPREYLLGYESAESVSNNGGDWFLALFDREKERVASLLEQAPLAMEITTPAGHRVGITHADTHSDWKRMKSQIRSPECERDIINLLVGSRDKINLVKAGLKEFEEIKDIITIDIDATRRFLLRESEMQVFGIDHVFHGHTPVDAPLTVANRTWIDTDKGSEGGKLSVIDVDQWLIHLEKRETFS